MAFVVLKNYFSNTKVVFDPEVFIVFEKIVFMFRFSREPLKTSWKSDLLCCHHSELLISLFWTFITFKRGSFCSASPFLSFQILWLNLKWGTENCCLLDSLSIKNKPQWKKPQMILNFCYLFVICWNEKLKLDRKVFSGLFVFSCFLWLGLFCELCVLLYLCFHFIWPLCFHCAHLPLPLITFPISCHAQL